MSIEIKRESYKNEEGGVIDINIDAADQILIVEKMLGELKGKAPSTLRDAVNATAKEMKIRLHEQAKTVYASKQINYKKNVKIHKASISKLTARLHTSGERTALSKHKVSPGRLVYEGKKPPKQYKAKVLQSSPLEIMKKGNLKSFLVKFQSDHKALVQRDPSGEYGEEGRKKRIEKYGKNADMTRIVEKKALSVAEMLGSPKVYGIVENGMGNLLQREIENFVQKTIDREAAKKR